MCIVLQDLWLLMQVVALGINHAFALHIIYFTEWPPHEYLISDNIWSNMIMNNLYLIVNGHKQSYTHWLLNTGWSHIKQSPNDHKSSNKHLIYNNKCPKNLI